VQAVILVGGQGTRLRPLTLTTPKPLVPLANQPVIEHIVRWLERYGVTEIILATQYQAEAFERWLKRWRGVAVRTVEEPMPLGTAGAVAQLSSALRGTTVVVNGDNLMDLDLDAMLTAHQARRAAISISVDDVADPTGRGVVVSDSSGRVSAFQEKPAPGTALADTVNTGVYILEPSVLIGIPTGQFRNFEQHIFPEVIANQIPVYAFQTKHVWIDTGTPEGYLRAQTAVLEGLASKPSGQQIGAVWQEEMVTLDGAARIVGPAALGFGTAIAAEVLLNASSVGRDCHVLAGAHVERSAIWDRCQVEAGAVVVDSIIGYGCYIGSYARVEGTVVGDGAVIAAGAVAPRGTRIEPGLTYH